MTTHTEKAAADMLGTIDSDIADDFVDDADAPNPIDWITVERNYPMLSSGEQAIVQLARHLGGYAPSENLPLVTLLGRVDSHHQHTFLGLLAVVLAGMAR